MTRGFLALLGLLALAGCAAPVSSSVYDSGAPSSLFEVGGDSETLSLFASDAALLSDADIDRILAHRFTPRPLNRIAVVALGHNYWFGWSDELSRSGTEVQRGLVAALRASPKVYDAAYLPTLLIPEKGSIGAFREAGARFQADLMLIYQTSCRTYAKFRFFAPDEAKSYCNVEAVLIDTRTGIAPFAVTASRDFVTVKQAGDMDTDETRRRVELQAVGDALAEIGAATAAYLGKAGG